MIKVIKELERQDVADVLVTALESGYSWWLDFRVSGAGEDWWKRILRTTTTIRVWGEDPNDSAKRVVKSFTLDEFAQAWADSDLTLDAGAMDADAADRVLQELVYGRVIYG